LFAGVNLLPHIRPDRSAGVCDDVLPSRVVQPRHHRRHEILETGSGPDLLYLHAGEGADPGAAFLPLLVRHFRVLMPAHPGFGLSDLPDHVASMDDLSYFYLDLMELTICAT